MGSGAQVITPLMRATVVDWLMEVSFELGLSRETL
jgi:hypothetical protein